MLTTDREKAICAKYGTHDAKGYVHCDECPLRVSKDGAYAYDVACKATAHYDRHLKKWVMDEVEG